MGLAAFDASKADPLSAGMMDSVFGDERFKEIRDGAFARNQGSEGRPPARDSLLFLIVDPGVAPYRLLVGENLLPRGGEVVVVLHVRDLVEGDEPEDAFAREGDVVASSMMRCGGEAKSASSGRWGKRKRVVSLVRRFGKEEKPLRVSAMPSQR